MSASRKEEFSDAFYLRHRRHLIRGLFNVAVTLTFTGSLAVLSFIPILDGEGDVLAASVFTAVFLFVLWSAYRSVPHMFRVRLVPYFEKKLDGANTFFAGESLLLHSRHLDALAKGRGVRELSEFASGDDWITGETVQWHVSQEGLKTVESLMALEAGKLSTDVVSDLALLECALRSASEKDIRFCLLLREGTSVSGLELDRRMGSFF